MGPSNTLSEFPSVESRPPCLSITVDDGYETVIRDLADALASRGLKATFYVHGDRMPTSRKATHALAPVEALKRCLLQGHELGGHSYHHLSWPSLTHEERLEELSLMFRFSAECGAIPRTFAYPYGHVDEATHFLVSQFFETAVLSFAIDDDSIRSPCLLSRIPIDPDWSEEQLEKVIASSGGGPTWTILMVHYLSTEDVRRLVNFAERKYQQGWKVDTVTSCWAALESTRWWLSQLA